MSPLRMKPRLISSQYSTRQSSHPYTHIQTYNQSVSKYKFRQNISQCEQTCVQACISKSSIHLINQSSLLPFPVEQTGRYKNPKSSPHSLLRTDKLAENNIQIPNPRIKHKTHKSQTNNKSLRHKIRPPGPSGARPSQTEPKTRN